ncbi:MAG: protein kinase, partial [Pirellulales bacterium]
MPSTLDDFIARVKQLGIASEEEVRAMLAEPPSHVTNPLLRRVASALVRAGKATEFQVQSLMDGTRIELGPYLFKEKIADGGMGQVFLARHRAMGRKVAVKIIHEKRLGSRHAVARFQREILALASLQHPHIVTAFDAGEIDGVPYLAMEYIDGRNLADEVKHNGRMPVKTAIEYIRQAALGLQYIHSQGIIHRDIKPSNLFVERMGTVKILDLGLSRWADWRDREQPDTANDLTADGDLLGTVDFMAPEQFANLRKVDHRSDIYSLGCTLYFLLHARAPFPGGSAGEKLVAHREQPIPALSKARPDIGQQLEKVYQRMLAKDPSERFSQVDDLLKALDALGSRASESLATTAYGSTADAPIDVTPERSQGRISWRRAAAATCLLGAVVAALFWANHWRFGTPPRNRPVSQSPVRPLAGMPDAAPASGAQPAPASDEVASGTAGEPATEAPLNTALDPQPPLSLEHAAAEWVFKQGGTIDALHQNQFLASLGILEDLPAPPFQIMRINLAGTKIPSGELRHLEPLSQVSWLDLSRTNIGNDDLKSLSRFDRLETLNLIDSKISDDGLAHILRLERLQTLDLRGSLVTDEGLGLIARNLPLTRLLLGEGQHTTDLGLKQLRPLRTLTSLGLRNTAVTNVGLLNLVELPELAWLDLGNTG